MNIPGWFPLELTGFTSLLFAVQGATVHNAAMNTGIQISLQGNDSFPLDTYPKVELLYHMVVLFLTFWVNSILFFIVAVPIYILTNSALGFPFLHILPRTYLVFFIIPILRCEMIPIVFFICISQISLDYLQGSLLFGGVLLLLSCMGSPYIFWILTLYQSCGF